MNFTSDDELGFDLNFIRFRYHVETNLSRTSLRLQAYAALGDCAFLPRNRNLDGYCEWKVIKRRIGRTGEADTRLRCIRLENLELGILPFFLVLGLRHGVSDPELFPVLIELVQEGGEEFGEAGIGIAADTVEVHEAGAAAGLTIKAA